MRNIDNESIYISLDETARLLSVSGQTVRRSIRRGDLSAIKLGSRVLVRRESLQRLSGGGQF